MHTKCELSLKEIIPEAKHNAGPHDRYIRKRFPSGGFTGCLGSGKKRLRLRVRADQGNLHKPLDFRRRRGLGNPSGAIDMDGRKFLLRCRVANTNQIDDGVRARDRFLDRFLVANVDRDQLDLPDIAQLLHGLISRP